MQQRRDVEHAARIDVHSHLLPGIDDGCQTVEESVACARALVEAGYSHAFCTPHIWPSLPRNTIANIRRWTAELQQELDRRMVRLTVLPGGEINLTPQFMQTDPAGVVTYALAGRFAIFDLWADRLPSHFEPAVRWLQALGLKVLLAHPERMRAVQDEPDLADYFDDLGLLLQGNLQCFCDPSHTPTRRTAELLLTTRRYFCLGSDCHGLQSLDTRLPGLDVVRNLVGADALDRLTIVNPRQLLP